MNILTIQHLSKDFGNKVVLEDLNLEIPQGIIYGFVGENGAGKTTTMRLILGLEEATSGKISVYDESVIFGDTATNRHTGYLPDVPQFYPYMTAREYMTLCGNLTGVDKNELSSKISELLQQVGLEDNKRKIKGFSRGMKQRLGIGQALLNDPELLICDEPTSALDPKGRQHLLDLLASLKGKMTIIFSTHILDDVERICDRVGILHRGKLVEEGTLDGLKRKYAQSSIQIVFEKTEEVNQFQQILKKYPAITAKIGNLNKRIEVFYQNEEHELYKTLLKLLVDNQLIPISIEKKESSLEEIFLEVIK